MTVDAAATSALMNKNVEEAHELIEEMVNDAKEGTSNFEADVSVPVLVPAASAALKLPAVIEIVVLQESLGDKNNNNVAAADRLINKITINDVEHVEDAVLQT
ncbi:hypothetical protein A2U01_0043166, partial [Trifolium medium]|nr:hypothetical protein [Trifolium medium]